MASLLAKAKAAKQAKIQTSAEAPQWCLDAHERRAKGLRAKETKQYAIEAQQYESVELGWSQKHKQEPMKLNNMPFKLKKYEPMELRWSPNQKQKPMKLKNMPLKLKIWANGIWVKPKAKTVVRSYFTRDITAIHLG